MIPFLKKSPVQFGHVSVIDKHEHKNHGTFHSRTYCHCPEAQFSLCIRKGGILGFESLFVFMYNSGLPTCQVF